MKIAIQGTEGSFHHIAAQHFYGEGHQYVNADTFAGVFASVGTQVADRGVVAIENSMYGSITEVYDLLEKHRFPVIGEVIEHINQELIGFPGTRPGDIKRIISHPVALAQCQHYLDNHFPQAEIIEHHDTAAAVELIKRAGDTSNAAIAGATAAELYDMEIIERGIQDEPRNFTRFLAIDPDGTPPEGADKASLILTTRHDPGALHRALGVFADAGGNLTKLQSRPIPGKVWKYQFYIDIEISPAALATSIEMLHLQHCSVANLGMYKMAEISYED